MRQPDLCDGCLEPIDDTEGWIGVDTFVPADEYDEDDDPDNDEDYQQRFHGWHCIWPYAGRQVEELPSIPPGSK